MQPSEVIKFDFFYPSFSSLVHRVDLTFPVSSFLSLYFLPRSLILFLCLLFVRQVFWAHRLRRISTASSTLRPEITCCHFLSDAKCPGTACFLTLTLKVRVQLHTHSIEHTHAHIFFLPLKA